MHTHAVQIVNGSGCIDKHHGVEEKQQQRQQQLRWSAHHGVIWSCGCGLVGRCVESQESKLKTERRADLRVFFFFRLTIARKVLFTKVLTYIIIFPARKQRANQRNWREGNVWDRDDAGHQWMDIVM